MIEKIAKRVLEKIAIRKGYARHMAGKIPADAMHHGISANNIGTFLDTGKQLMTPLELASRGISQLSTEDTGMGRTVKSLHTGHLTGAVQPGTPSILDMIRLNENVFDDPKGPYNIYKGDAAAFMKKTTSRGIERALQRSGRDGLLPPTERAFDAFYGSSASRAEGIGGKNALDISFFSGLPSNKGNAYGVAGVIPTKFTGAVDRSTGLLLGDQLNLGPLPIESSPGKVALPKVTEGVNFYYPKEVMRDGTDGLAVAKRLKQEGFLPVATINKYVKKLQKMRAL